MPEWHPNDGFLQPVEGLEEAGAFGGSASRSASSARSDAESDVSGSGTGSNASHLSWKSKTSSLLSRRQGTKNVKTLANFMTDQSREGSIRSALQREGFVVGGVIGRSSANQGYTVLRAEKSGRPWAAKCSNEGRGGGILFTTLTNEFSILEGLCHASIVRPEKLVESDTGAAMLMELCPGIRLDLLLPRDGTLCPPQRHSVMSNILSGVEYMHAKGVAHMDIHCQNIVVDSGPGEQVGSAKMVDFGSARLVGKVEGGSSSAGSDQLDVLENTDRRFAPPDPPGSYFECDVFACGLVEAALLAGRLVVTKDVVRDGALQIPHGLLTLDAKMRGHLVSALTPDAAKRATAEAFLEALPPSSSWLELASNQHRSKFSL